MAKKREASDLKGSRAPPRPGADDAHQLHQAGWESHDAGQLDQAEALYRQAIEIRRRSLGEQHPFFANSLNNLAELYRAMGRYEEAEPLFHQALEIRRQVLGEGHPVLAQSLNNLAALYYSTGRSQDAEPLLRQAAEIFLKILGPRHPSTVNCRANYDKLKREMESRGQDQQ